MGSRTAAGSGAAGPDPPMKAASDNQLPVVVASVPASHVYVRHIASEQGDGVVRLPDPEPTDPQRSAQQVWWPPVMLQPSWVENHDFDVFHIQFGFDAWTPEELRALVASLRRTGRPLVHTVHDLRNPHHRDRRQHDAQLDVLIPAADAVITLTDGAAKEIADRWRRDARVLPHPHVVPFERMRRPRDRASDGSFRVGLHVKSLRASMNPSRLLSDLVHAVRGIPGGVLQVNGHRDVLTSDGLRRDALLAQRLEDLAASGDVDLRIHDFMSDEALWDYLTSVDVSVLPYSFGTHSGWLEACRDLGTAVVAPSCGYYADQGPVHTYTHDEQGYDGQSLRDAVMAAWANGRITPLTVEARRSQRAEIARGHHDIYEAVTA